MVSAWLSVKVDINQANTSRLGSLASAVKRTKLFARAFSYIQFLSVRPCKKITANTRAREAEQTSAVPTRMPSKDYSLNRFPRTKTNRSETSGPHSSGVRSALAFARKPRAVWTTTAMPLRKHVPRVHLFLHLGTKRGSGGLIEKEKSLLAAMPPSLPAQACAPGPGLVLGTGVLGRHESEGGEDGKVRMAKPPMP